MYEMDQYTVSLLHFDDGIKDESGKVWTANGGAAISTNQSKMGSKSLYLAGNQYLSTPNTTDFDFGAGDFTIDWWEYRTAAPTGNGALFCRGTSIQKSPIVIGIDVNANSTNEAFSGSSNSNILRPSDYDIALGSIFGTYDLNRWNHFAVCRKDTKFYLFKNGVLTTTFTSAGAFAVVDSTSLIGKDRDNEVYFIGYIDEFRISKGIARWTENFTPETPPTTETQLLRVTVSDSSDHDYQLSSTEIDSFVNWFMKHASTDTAGYMLNKKVGTQESKEYLAFEKIISFEVMPLTK
ncbi:hypothetical protein Ga0466249_003404 [Sporomusaceae bacterium BoRhaA]|uniref:LamG domain-containing protein n=1 Tax=Pelorhabdus rhamnosifermentans TaxID=2772457 RepID=UPI001C0642C8|nr:LamG domain-containing protein [Pelorhabdus rhamnosifermentans]MBU2702277.1 hypothetical protein [Pelorhabdus rhamnosifermentans]